MSSDCAEMTGVSQSQGRRPIHWGLEDVIRLLFRLIEVLLHCLGRVDVFGEADPPALCLLRLLRWDIVHRLKDRSLN